MQNSINSSEPVPKKAKTVRSRLSTKSSSKKIIESLEMAAKRSAMANESTTTVTEQEDVVMESASSESGVDYLGLNGYDQDEWEQEDNCDIVQLIGDMINDEENDRSQSKSGEPEEENDDESGLLQENTSYVPTYEARGKKKKKMSITQ